VPPTARGAAGFDITAPGDLESFALDLHRQEIEEGLEVMTIKLTRAQREVRPLLRMEWGMPVTSVG
jgi:hypothetical protein